jgi:hypothetical protein
MGDSGHGTHMGTLMAETINGPAEFNRAKTSTGLFQSL